MQVLLFVNNSSVVYRSPVRTALITGFLLLVVSFIGLGILYTLSYRAEYQVIRHNLGTLAKIAASQVDGNLHARLIRPDQGSGPDYARAVEPLLRIHNSDPDIYYLYTERYIGNVSYYILDTATCTGRLRTRWPLKPSAIMEPVDQSDPKEDALCLVANKRGEVYVYSKTYRDPLYGVFLTASAPFRDSAGRFEGVVSIDYSTESLAAAMMDLRRAFFLALGVMVMVSFSVGALAGFAVRTYNERERERLKAVENGLQLERRIQHTQRLESLGMLAGGIAHDFNNILTVIIGNIDLIGIKNPQESERFRELDDAKKAAFRAADLTHQMLAYAGKGRLVSKPVLLNTVVRDTIALLRGSIPGTIGFDLKLNSALPLISADPSQIQQVVMNLIVNSAEAIGGENGSITVTTGIDTIEVPALNGNVAGRERSDARVIFLEVADTGCGMDENTREHIFDPFFSTKFTGRGLGMSAVHGIVKSHNGVIHVNSTPGMGAVIRVSFPLAEEPLQQIETVTLTREKGKAPVFSGMVLLAEDEEGVRETVREMLRHLGFTVLTAVDGVEAVSVFQENADELACIVLDVTMPGMDGIEAFKQIRRAHPESKIILSSGYIEEEVRQRLAGNESVLFIHKPFKIEELRQVIETALMSA